MTGMGSSWHHVVVDASDPARLARWWARVLSYRVVYEDHEETDIAPAPGEFPQLVFVAVPEAKAGKNRLHLDLNPDDQTAEVERLVDMGARRVDLGQPEKATWVVLADPEGNEFCVLSAR
jgi:catechol 2,3-dioxygenase-like lactoylglutathione lyase family enzyme